MRGCGGAPPRPSDVDPQAWSELCETLDEMGVLSRCDRTVMQLWCSTYSEYQLMLEHVRLRRVSVETARGGQVTSPEAHQYNKLADRLIKLCAELGLTPSHYDRRAECQ